MFKTLINGLFRRLGYQLVRSRTVQDIYSRHTRELEETVAAYERQTRELLDENRRLQNEKERDLGVWKQSADATAAQNAQLRIDLEAQRDSFRSVLEQLTQLQSSLVQARRASKQSVTLPSTSSTDHQELDAAHWTRLGEIEQEKGDFDRAAYNYGRAMSLIHGYGPARNRMLAMSQAMLPEATRLFHAGQWAEAKRALVRVIELNPLDQPARQMLERIIAADGRYDLTKQCWVHLDPERGKTVYREAFLRSLEYVAAAGIVGEVLEFGVLSGFTARLQSEIMRDLMIWKEIHLFDSFEGLPEYISAIDRDSYDIGERNLWADRMRFPDEFVRDRLGAPVDVHIFNHLSEVIRPERIRVYRGFFSETLQHLPPIKAALVHVDCDLYQSTKEMFEALYAKDVLQDGCVLMFDDYNCFKANPNFGERRAFQEFLDSQSRFTSTPFFSYGFNGAAFFLHDRTVGADTKD